MAGWPWVGWPWVGWLSAGWPLAGWPLAEPPVPWPPVSWRPPAGWPPAGWPPAALAAVAGLGGRGGQQLDRFRLVQNHRGQRDRQPGGAERRDQLGSRRRHDQGNDRVHPDVTGHRGQGSAERLGADRGGGVHRAAERRAGREDLGQPGLGGVTGRGDHESCLDARVRGQHARAARIGQDADPAARRHGLGGEQDGRLEQLTEARGGDDPGLLEQGLPGDQRRGGRGGMRGGRALAGRRPAGVHGQHRHGWR